MTFKTIKETLVKEAYFFDRASCHHYVWKTLHLNCLKFTLDQKFNKLIPLLGCIHDTKFSYSGQITKFCLVYSFKKTVSSHESFKPMD